MKHPKFLKNQVSLEIDCAVKAVPGFVCKWCFWVLLRRCGSSPFYV
jgi:lathosterol oxidase